MKIFRNVNPKLFLLVWISSIFGLLAVIPYSLTIQSTTLNSIELPLPLALIVFLQVSFNSLIFGILIYFGLLLSNKYNLGLPFIERKLKGEPLPSNFTNIIFLSIVLGVLVALLIYLLDLWVFNFDNHLSNLGLTIPEIIIPAKWEGFLASFYGGITEETLLRLFFLTLIIWLIMIATRTKTNFPSNKIFWVANIIAAIVFGLGHLPATFALGIPLDGFVITRAIILNGIGGVLFGWLYFTRGLESAMIAHFCGDLTLHVIL